MKKQEPTENTEYTGGKKIKNFCIFLCLSVYSDDVGSNFIRVNQRHVFFISYYGKKPFGWSLTMPGACIWA